MSYGKQKAPPTPNLAGAAQITSNNALNLAQNAQQSNNYNQVTPYGTTNYSNTPQFDQQAYDQAMAQYNANPSLYGGVPPTKAQFITQNWTATQNLSPQEQAILSGGQGLQLGEQGLAQNAFDMNKGVLNNPTVDTSQLPSMGVNPGQTYYDAMLERQAPQMKQMTEMTNQQLANQGIPVGSEAWKLSQDQLARNMNDLYAADATQGMQAGMQANQQAFGQQQQNLDNRLQALYAGQNFAGTGSGVVTPGQSGVGGAQMSTPMPADLAKALSDMYGIQLGNVNANNAAIGNLMQLGGTMGSSYMLAGKH